MEDIANRQEELHHQEIKELKERIESLSHANEKLESENSALKYRNKTIESIADLHGVHIPSDPTLEREKEEPRESTVKVIYPEYD